MSGPKTRTNPVLVLIAIVLCLACGVLFSRSSANPSPIDEEQMPDVVLVENTDSSQSDESNTDATVLEKPTVTPTSEESVATPTPEPTEVPVEESEESDYVASPEATVGVWTPSGSYWMFLVDGVAYQGWLYDTDEKIYYFDEKGIMETGWTDIDDKRYYFNLDGILQTGDIVYKGKTYHLLENGSLEGYSVSEAAAKKKAKKEAEEQAAKEAEEQAAKEAEEKAAKETEEQAAKEAEEKTEKENKTAKASDGESTSTSEKKTVAFTFDDGPSSFTNRLLDCLEENNVKATFFLVGYEISSFPDEVKRMEELGMEIGNHTAEHKDLTKLSASDIQTQIETVNAQLTELVGHGASVLRPPYGSVNDTVKENASLPMILWSIDTLDWESKDAEKIADVVLSEIEDGSIILMHDIYSTTVDAVEILVPKLLEQGYELVTVHELAQNFDITLENGTTYRSMN